MTRSEAQKAGLETGTVKWFNDTKGFGFIVPDNGGRDVFLHATIAERSGIGKPVEGQHLAFKARNGHKGMTADEVHILDGAGR